MMKIMVAVDADLQELIPNYLLSREKDVAEILSSLQNSEFEVIKRLGHRMKGSGGGYGFMQITEVGSAIEQAACQQDSHKVRAQLHILTDYLDRVEVRYD